ncbi:rCG44063 [Rattus norvegicus]|uniref:RCG44063 n=1 Tax=Rattus norvegicus TaxID=10116 RepID=A6J6T0_RAT|nr:rCG44063 [Rattus norvegicus]
MSGGDPLRSCHWTLSSVSTGRSQAAPNSLRHHQTKGLKGGGGADCSLVSHSMLLPLYLRGKQHISQASFLQAPKVLVPSPRIPETGGIFPVPWRDVLTYILTIRLRFFCYTEASFSRTLWKGLRICPQLIPAKSMQSCSCAYPWTTWLGGRAVSLYFVPGHC